jgi:diaminopimelate epimerase
MSSPSVLIPFTKANGCGNDFLIIDGKYAPRDLSSFTRRICDRHTGVGADGVEWVFPAEDADASLRLINADGSEAEISGNGTRCVAAYLCNEHPRDRLILRTGAGVKLCTLMSFDDVHYEFEMAMGSPIVGSEQTLKLTKQEIRGIPVSMGNPHYVVFVTEFQENWQHVGAEIGERAEFEDGVNVEFVRVRDHANVDARFYERGVGETQSSGTGSCASAVAAIAAQYAKSPVHVHAPGGVQTVRWDGEVYLRGPAELICRGEFFVKGS